ncbi:MULTISPECIES: LysR family transcriptional regulator [Rhizobium]|uniref:LysR family transcriptional regulator n=1 Tax=Rhizobium anhuiense TaxID=1184720 RepID=A0ABX4J9C1_9HYPH|nr:MULTISPECIES: LysR family transcriptional regulator [Rhizobium]KZS53049.1 LysR family transcriptional regulator [Rhizobium anhuiense bv. trifolii]MBB3298970.1 DNA-binding transcriptional LysR family regulator [Rhizobium sp. BK112]MBB3368306.1 DNA-binding transcriptional LysR family regulator [Rhizobium sp. BK077]MBB3744615.1 DNA-binding transcriptional LysR family regulator [Rhizobium sp. BK591]MBB4114514.1 DNA-binding transcriptional LysR family regulator [Rhizobium sp. BK226]
MHLGALFIASHVLTSGSVRETARRFQLSPSTVSTAIHNLETELAIKLTERASGELVTLIASGRVLDGLEPIMAAIAELGQLTGHDGAAEAYETWASRIPVKIVTMERFLEVADQGSINRAARRLRLGQPQLSLQLANLEKFLGARLFERQAQGSVLTEEGRRAYQIFMAISQAWNDLKSSADERYRRTARSLRIGSIIPTGSESWVARCLGVLVSEWNARRNNNAISLVSMTADDLREALKNGRIDVAILDSVFGLESFRHRELLQTDMVVIAPPDSTEMSVADLVAGHAICMPSPRTGLGHAAMAFSYERAPNRRLRGQDITAADSLPVIVDLVANHGYVSFLGRVSALPIADKVRIVDLDVHLPMSYHVAFNHRKAAADACTVIIEAAARITSETVAQTKRQADAGARETAA